MEDIKIIKIEEDSFIIEAIFEGELYQKSFNRKEVKNILLLDLDSDSETQKN